MEPAEQASNVGRQKRKGEANSLRKRLFAQRMWEKNEEGVGKRQKLEGVGVGTERRRGMKGREKI